MRCVEGDDDDGSSNDQQEDDDDGDDEKDDDVRDATMRDIGQCNFPVQQKSN